VGDAWNAPSGPELFEVTEQTMTIKVVKKRERFDVMAAAILLALGLLGAFMVGAI
jgi:hypothetical protein